METNNLRAAHRTPEKLTKKAPNKPLQGIPHKNLIMSIFNERGFKTVVPTVEVLQILDITLHRFNKILDNKTELTLNEATSFAAWLGVQLHELTTAPPPEITIADKHGIEN